MWPASRAGRAHCPSELSPHATARSVTLDALFDAVVAQAPSSRGGGREPAAGTAGEMPSGGVPGGAAVDPRGAPVAGSKVRVGPVAEGPWAPPVGLEGWPPPAGLRGPPAASGLRAPPPSRSLSPLPSAGGSPRASAGESGEALWVRTGREAVSASSSSDGGLSNVPSVEGAYWAANAAVGPGSATEVDVVVEGGGMKGYYVSGAAAVLQRQLPNLQLCRFAGASAGALCASCLCCNVDPSVWAMSYNELKPGRDNENLSLMDIYRRTWFRVMPVNAYKLCSGRVFISITVVTRSGLRNLIVSEYTSNEDLFAAIKASTFIPQLTDHGWSKTFRGHTVFDGGLTNNLPVFTDGKRPQIVVHLSKVHYPGSGFLSYFFPNLDLQDTCIEALAVRGAYDMKRFLSGEEVSSIEWRTEKREIEGSAWYWKYLLIATITAKFLLGERIRAVLRKKRRTTLVLFAIGLSPSIVHYGGRFYRAKRNHTMVTKPSHTQSKSMRNFSIDKEMSGHWLLGEAGGQGGEGEDEE